MSLVGQVWGTPDARPGRLSGTPPRCPPLSNTQAVPLTPRADHGRTNPGTRSARICLMSGRPKCRWGPSAQGRRRTCEPCGTGLVFGERAPILSAAKLYERVELGEDMGCPHCGSAEREPIAPGFWRCTSVSTHTERRLVGVDGNIPIYQDFSVSRVCGTEYQELTGDMSGRVAVCDCGTFAIGRCSDCDRNVCGSEACSTMHEGKRRCQDCMAPRRRVEAEARARAEAEASANRQREALLKKEEIRLGFLPQTSAIERGRNDGERALIAAGFSEVSAGGSVSIPPVFRYLYPYDASNEYSLMQPYYTPRVSRPALDHFLNEAAARGLQPTTREVVSTTRFRKQPILGASRWVFPLGSDYDWRDVEALPENYELRLPPHVMLALALLLGLAELRPHFTRDYLMKIGAAPRVVTRGGGIQVREPESMRVIEWPGANGTSYLKGSTGSNS